MDIMDVKEGIVKLMGVMHVEYQRCENLIARAMR